MHRLDAQARCTSPAQARCTSPAQARCTSPAQARCIGVREGYLRMCVCMFHACRRTYLCRARRIGAFVRNILCIYVCMYVCMYVFRSAGIDQLHTQTRCICVKQMLIVIMYCELVCSSVYIYVCVCKWHCRIHTYKHVRVCAYIHVRTYIYIYMCA